VRAERFRWLRGEEKIAFFDAPILRDPPAYRRSFCRTCGAPVPAVFARSLVVTIPTGLVEGELPVRVADLIWVSQRARWLDLREIAELPEHEGDPSAESNARLMQPLGLAR
jgi:hypothetical protein